MIKNKLLFLPVFLMSLSVSAQMIFEDNFDGTNLNMQYWNYEKGDGCPDCGAGVITNLRVTTAIMSM